MSDIVLSSATRQSLISAQDTAALMAQTQNRLSTGKKVNSALDNPTEFFTASGLNSRASDLSNLLDGISNGIQTIQAASTGITNIQKLVDSAKSTANQALSTTVSTTGTASSTFGTASSTVSAVAGSLTGSAVGTAVATDALNATAPGLAANDTITIGGKTVTVTTASTGTSDATHIKADATIADLTAKFQSLGVNLTFDATAHKFTATSSDSTGSTNISVGTDAATKLGFASGASSTNATKAVAAHQEIAAATVLKINVNGTEKDVSVGDHTSIGDTVTALNAAVGSSAFSVDSTGTKLVVDSSSQITVTDSNTKTALGLTSTDLTVTGADTRAKLADQYNDLLDQIDQLASDASYNGVNLLNNDDPSNKLHLAFNEQDSSNLDVQGVNAKSAGLGLTKISTTDDTAKFINDSDVKSTITKLTNATTSLRQYSSTFGSNLTVVQNRQDFTKNLTNVLQTGASNLTDADLNEEAANSQALSTRQSLAISALSLANTAQQGVLQLLR